MHLKPQILPEVNREKGETYPGVDTVTFVQRRNNRHELAHRPISYANTSARKSLCMDLNGQKGVLLVVGVVDVGGELTPHQPRPTGKIVISFPQQSSLLKQNLRIAIFLQRVINGKVRWT